MLNLLAHLYEYAEVYTVILVWITVPLGFFSIFFFYRKHYGMFMSPEAMKSSAKGASGHGANR